MRENVRRRRRAVLMRMNVGVDVRGSEMALLWRQPLKCRAFLHVPSDDAAVARRADAARLLEDDGHVAHVEEIPAREGKVRQGRVR